MPFAKGLHGFVRTVICPRVGRGHRRHRGVALPSAPPPQLIPGRFQGVLAEGAITQASLVGSLAGQSLSVLLDNIASGLAYVNVHTSQFPPGEIRGQIQ